MTEDAPVTIPLAATLADSWVDEYGDTIMGHEPQFDEVFPTLEPQEGGLEQALVLLWTSAGVDGGHHKDWVLNQILGALVGAEGAQRFIQHYEAPFAEPGGEPDHVEWQRGVPI